MSIPPPRRRASRPSLRRACLAIEAIEPRILFAANDSAFPHLLSINRAGSTPTTASSVDFTVAFNQPVTGVSPSNFAIAAGSGVHVSSLNITTVDDATYTVHLAGISGPGSLGLNLSDPTGIHDLAE